MSRVEIDFDVKGGGTVRVDGKELKSVTELSVDYDAGGIPRVQLTLIITDGYVRIEEGDTTIEPRIVTQNRQS